YLSTICKTNGYQGYVGPGWSGHAMLPLEFAFSADDDSPVQAIAPTDLARIEASEMLFSPALREIPHSAELIQAELNRAVWNGNVALAREVGANSTFSKTLLREIGHTGMRTRDVFSGAIDNVNQTVVSAILRDCGAKAALAVDIMDRNLYERANDCRWWALTTAFRRILGRGHIGTEDRAEMSAILEAINRLYTVYTNLVVFDDEGCIVASSNGAYADRIGRRIDAPWVGETLALSNTESYAVSAFEASPLYEGRPTYVYAAAIRSLERNARAVGGIAIVFDAEPQFRAMLNESLPHDETGTIKPGAFGVFVDSDGRVIASSRADLSIGSELALDAIGSASSWARVLTFEDGLFAVGSRRSSGYREYKGEHDPYRNEITALVFVPLTAARQIDAAPSAPPPLRQTPRHRDDEATIDLASFAIGGQWYALEAASVIEAVKPGKIATLPEAPRHVRGCTVVRDELLPVIDLPALLAVESRASESQFIVVVRATEQTGAFGVLVDELGEALEVLRARVLPIEIGQADALIERVVTPEVIDSDDPLLFVLSSKRLAAYASQPRARLSA
ncbi:MAG TPA: chemotaxis protein CheW, partial [Polyangiales bacterium]|nr:chemotaxis protein CheW [Polyangiales bacterium]